MNDKLSPSRDEATCALAACGVPRALGEVRQLNNPSRASDTYYQQLGGIVYNSSMPLIFPLASLQLL